AVTAVRRSGPSRRSVSSSEMDPADALVSIADVKRILLGTAPWWFLFEVAVRALVLYAMLLVAMRLMGKRVAAQLSTIELVVVLTLGASVGPPIQMPETGLLCAAVVLTIALVVQRGISSFSIRSRRFENLTQGVVTIIVEDGRLVREALSAASLSREKLFASLRSSGILELGELRRVYLEASGQLTLVPWQRSRAGLSLMPDATSDVAGLDRDAALRACTSCGEVATP